MKNKKLWFKAKMFGWGWTPVSWQGLVLTVVYIGGIAGQAVIADKFSHSGTDTLINFAIPFVTNTVLFLVICYAKGEKPRWRWGKK